MGLLDLPKSISNDYLADGECGLEQGGVVEVQERADMAFGCLGTADMLLALPKWILIDNFTVDLNISMRYV